MWISGPIFYVWHMLSGFEQKVAGFAEGNDCFGMAGKILLAVSGGADSTALLYVMTALKDEGVLGADIVCAHINHQLRGVEADLDEDFVAEQCESMNIPLMRQRVDVRGFARENKLSIETAALKLRIKSLLDIAKENDCNRIVTAHQKNDNAETVLQRLSRGTGYRGLGGIWPVREFGGVCFVRPMLCVTREEVIGYLQGRGLKWCTDHTNEDCTYRRNFIRHRLQPGLQKECSSSVVEQLFELSRSARRFYGLVCERAEKAWPELADCGEEKAVLDLRMFSTQPMAVKVELIRRGLTAVGSGEGDLTQKHYERTLQLAQQNVSGREIGLASGFAVRREYGSLIFAQAEKPEEKTSKSMDIEVPGRTKFGDYVIEATVLEVDKCDVERFKAEKTEFVEWFDFDKVKLPLAVRFRRAGDRFRPLGLAGEKKVGKFLTAEKVPQEMRRNVLIVADSERIIWVWPIRMSEQVKVGGETKKILQLRIEEDIDG